MHHLVETDWRKSSKSSSGNCVEIRADGPRVLIRDSKDRSGPILAFDREVFEAFIAELKAGDLFEG